VIRSMARRSLFIVVVSALVAAGCVGTATKDAPPPPPPPPPPRATQICGQNFSSAGNYLISFYNLGHANTGFITADGFVPIRLPDGRTAWWMSDTNRGTANPDNTWSNEGGVHNSVVWQEGSCLRPQFGNPEMMPNSGGAWFWPGSAVVDGNTITVFAYKVVPASGSPGFEWRVIGTSFARYSLPSLQLISGPIDMPTTNAPNGGEPVPWGIRSFLSGNTVYLYGTTRFTNPFAGPVAEAWLARAPLSDPTQLEYFTNPVAVTPATPEWSPNFNDAKPMSFTENALPKSSPLAQLSVVPYGNRFLAAAFAADVFQDEQGRSFVRAWVADTPTGPWKMVMNGTNPRDVFTFQKRSPDQVAYDARIPQLSGGAGSTVVYSANDPIRGWQDWTLYRGEFATPSGLPSP
jgi:hypothetical protein